LLTGDAPKKIEDYLVSLDGSRLESDILKIGNFYIEITGELKPGNKMDKVFVGLKQALTHDWRGGVTGKVLNDGMIHENDKVTLMERA